MERLEGNVNKELKMQMNRKSEIHTAYRLSRNVYDDVLTQQNAWARLYVRFLWDVDDNEYA